MSVVVVAVAGGAFALWLLTTFLFRVSGTWERELTPAERESGMRPERITLGQLGPLVTGRREVPGGWQELSGLLVGRTLRLTRRDHGVKALVALGFPEPVAHKLDGEVTARLELGLKGGMMPLFLEGSFIPQKVEFTHQPPRITRSYFLEAQPRRYRKLDAVVVDVEAPAG
ncbi:MAG: hypothetical protein Q8O67_12515 [Deltaproteobacteria bacterium]|nr:hypothetical protein [Deltaproteobacteria bacterium]